MTAKEFLSQAHRLDQRINSKLEQVASLRDMTTKITSIMSDDPVSHTRNVHSMQDIIAKIVDTQDEINKDIDALVDLKRDIMHCIKRINNPEYQTLLELRYLSFKSWSEIALLMDFEDRYVYKVHGCALKEVEKILSSRQ